MHGAHAEGGGLHLDERCPLVLRLGFSVQIPWHVLRLHESIDPQLVPIINAFLGRIGDRQDLVHRLELVLGLRQIGVIGDLQVALGQDLLRLAQQYHDVFGTDAEEPLERGLVYPDLLNDVEAGMCTDHPVDPRSPVVPRL